MQGLRALPLVLGTGNEVESFSFEDELIEAYTLGECHPLGWIKTKRQVLLSDIVTKDILYQGSNLSGDYLGYCWDYEPGLHIHAIRTISGKEFDSINGQRQK